MVREARPQDGSRLDGWRILRSHGLSVVDCTALHAAAGVGHVFSTRRGPGGDDFDLGAHDATDLAHADRRRRLCRAAGLDGQRPLLLRQVHGDRIVDGRQAAAGRPLEADAVCCLRDEAPGVAAAVRTADCVPILLADARGRGVAAVHAGWRGTARGIAALAVAALAERGIGADGLIAAIGPAIGQCCYEVGPEVAEAVAGGTGVPPGAISRSHGDRPTLDLALANRLQLERAGIPPGAVHVAPWCTVCHRDLFFSFRAEGGPTGRSMACIGWTGP